MEATETPRPSDRDERAAGRWLPLSLPRRLMGDVMHFARQMHQKPTASEAALWNRLKSRQLGVPFLSQECILGYIVDFYCPPAKLVVEVDEDVVVCAVNRVVEHRAV